MKALEGAGPELREGGNHTKVYRDGAFVSAVPRHPEIPPATVRAIARRTGVRLRSEVAMATFFPAVVEGSSIEGYGAEVLGTGANGSGATVRDALLNAAEVLQEVIDDPAASGEPIPSPGRVTDDDATRGTVALLQARVPAAAA